MADDRFVTVAVFYSLPSAVVARSALEARGFAVMAIGLNLVSVSWAMLVAVGGIELRVPAADEEAARALLGEGERPPLRESAAFWAAPIRNGLTLAILWVTAGMWLPFWIRRAGRTLPAESRS